MLGLSFNRASADAVQALRFLSREALQTESRVASGVKVSDPRDNGAVYAIALGQRSRIASYVSIADGISRARGLVDASLAAGSAIGGLLSRMKVAASAARSEDLTSEQRLALQSDYDALRAQIDITSRAGHFNGAILTASGGGDIDVVVSDQSSAGLVQQIRTDNSRLELGSISRISTDSSGAEAIGGTSYSPVFSPDGGGVAFVSNATNLVPGDTNTRPDLFFKDLQSGVVTRLSLTGAGAQLIGGGSFKANFSVDGQSVVFESFAVNVVAGDTNGVIDVFLKDLQTGAVTRVSTTSAGGQATGGPSSNPALSSDGRFVAFGSGATDLTPGDTNGFRDVFLKDLVTGAMARISTDSSGAQAIGGGSDLPKFSPDGRFVAFESDATNLVSGDTNGQTDIFLKDLQTGEVSRVSTSSSGDQSIGEGSFNAVFSPDGRYVAFESAAANLVSGDTNGEADIFLKDLLTGVLTRVSTNSSGGQANGGASSQATFSPDGRFLGFESDAVDLVAGDTNAVADAFIKNLKTGEVTRVSTDSSGVQATGGDSAAYAFSPDGTMIALTSQATNLVSGDTNGVRDVFLRPLESISTGTIPGRLSYLVGVAGVTTSDDTQFRIDGALIGTVDITATMTVTDYLEAVSTATGGRVFARYDADAGEFTYETAAISGGQGVLTLTSSGTARSWLGHGLAGANAASSQAAVITLEDQDWTVGGAGALSGVSSASGQLLSASGASLADAAIDTALTALNAQMALLGAKAKAIEVQDQFNASFVSTMEKNLSNLVDADLARESARLQSIQIKQQLAAQALSIANQAPQMILSLFRG
jgi:flagellin-like hook-associated protein FlgL